VPTLRVVEALEELKDGHPGLGLRAEPTAVQELALECREEALAQSVVVSVTDPHRGTDSGLPTALTEGDGSVLGSLVGVIG
jgi:hypothetical protein